MSDAPPFHIDELKAFLLDVPTHRVDLPGAPGPVFVRELLASEALDLPDQDTTLATLVRCLVDEGGAAVLTLEEAKRLPRRHLNVLIKEVNAANAWGEAAVETAAGN